jgi:PAS domain S-box-containing protein
MEIPKEWLAHIVESTSDAVIVLDRNRIIRFANKNAATMAEVESPETLIGVSYAAILAERRILDEEGREIPAAELASTRALEHGEEVRDRLVEQIHKNANFWVTITAVPIFDDLGQPEFAIVRYRNVSDIKSARDKLQFILRASEVLSITVDLKTRLREKARLTVPTLADWCTINIINNDGSLRRVAIVHRNPNRERLVEELAELSAMQLGSSAGIHKVVETGLSDFYPTVEKATFERPDVLERRRELVAELGVISSLVVPIRSGKKILGALSLAYAESGRHYTKDDLYFMEEFGLHLGVLVENGRLYDELSDRDKAKDAFLAALSHELRNPLAPIKSALELMQLKNESAQFEEEIATVMQQFDHLTKLLNDLLDVTRYNQGKIHIEKKPIELGSLIQNVESAYRPLIENKRIRLHVSLREEPLPLSGDRVRLEQAFMNILHNAYKFTQNGGNIWIEADAQGNDAIIRIRDSGTGILQSDLPHIFDLHFQGNNRVGGEYVGLGIGLVLVREILELHGGTIYATSKGSGGGSEFVVTLPLSRVQIPAIA